MKRNAEKPNANKNKRRNASRSDLTSSTCLSLQTRYLKPAQWLSPVQWFNPVQWPDTAQQLLPPVHPTITRDQLLLSSRKNIFQNLNKTRMWI